MKKLILLLVVAALVAGGYVGYTRYQQASEEAEELTAPPERKDLPLEAIRAKLKGDSFRDKLEAKRQIGKLPPADRLEVLRSLAKDEDVPTRTIAVQELGKLLPLEGAQKVLAELADNDGDAAVRALAQEKLSAPAEDEAAAGTAPGETP